MVAAETGQFMSIARQDTDRGVFTVQATDVPRAVLRRKPKRSRKSPTVKIQITNPTLEPIHEDNDETQDVEEEITEEMSLSASPSTLVSTVDSERTISRYDTPSCRTKSTELSIDLDGFDEELEKVPDITVDTDIVNMLSGLPPRPKCKRKMLPPSITNSANTDNKDGDSKRRKNKMLKLRKDLVKTLETVNRPSSRNTQTATAYHSRQTLESLSYTPRPKSAENKVFVVQLSDLGSSNSSSVPDLPSIMSRLASERLDSSHLRTLTRLSMRQSDDEPSKTSARSMYEDSGALSTPRRSPDSNDTNESKSKTESCLKGSDISSFYHMWDRDRNSRPFDKKDSGKIKLNVHRDCMCLIKNSARKCFDKRHSVLPPIPSPSNVNS
ncbi:hypothetical protein ACF0H5_006136 [Mactra antiquata]